MLGIHHTGNPSHWESITLGIHHAGNPSCWESMTLGIHDAGNPDVLHRNGPAKHEEEFVLILLNPPLVRELDEQDTLYWKFTVCLFLIL